jgi:hypothetical protein
VAYLALFQQHNEGKGEKERKNLFTKISFLESRKHKANTPGVELSVTVTLTVHCEKISVILP